MVSHFLCSICAADALEVIPGYSLLPRATSDSRPWPCGGTLAVCTQCGAVQKLPDAQWIEEITRIYRNYEIYHQSSGSEQLIFGDSGAEPRSKRLVEYVLKQCSPPARGKLLDIGCGDGAALRNFSQALPEWNLYGSELSTATLDSLRRIANFEHLFVGPLSEIEERFSLVSLIHTLEHIRNPQKELTAARDLLESNGVLFIEVPDIETSPFDLLVTDHLLHFSRGTLALLVTSCGLRTWALSNKIIFKEITLLARRGKTVVTASDPQRGIRIAKATISWLQDVVATAEAASSQGEMGIFGTAIAGMALYGALRDRVTFFVDEDPNRIGRQYDSRPILSLCDAPKGVPIFLALPSYQALKVADRCFNAGLRCVLPPDPGRIDD
jgi:SAM-dependent methyltransferase